MNSRQLAQKWKYPRHAEYEDMLRSSASNWFLAKQLSTHPRMSYCLDKIDNWKCNIILPEVCQYIDSVKTDKEISGRPFPLHKYVHHGLSSQAMLFNLIGPLIARKHYAPIINAFKGIGILISDNVTGEFEFEDRDVFNEDSGQPTSIDLILKDENGKPFIFIESKLVEAEFGGCSVFTKGDCNGKNPINDRTECYLHFIGRKYWDLLEKFGFTENLKNEKVCILVNYYQFFREVLLSLEKKGIFVLLFDERSPVFNYGQNRGLVPFLKSFVPIQHQDKVKLISIQALVESISISDLHKDWIEDFRTKYGIA